MVFGFQSESFSPIAVDFGTDCLKLLQIIDDETPRLAAAAAVTVPDHVRRDPAARDAFLVEAVVRLVKDGGFRGKRAVLSIPAPAMFVQHIKVPQNLVVPLDDQVRDQLRGRLPIEPEALIIRNIEVAEVLEDKQAKREVLCMAAAHRTVMRYVEVLRKARLQAVGMHAEPLAAVAAFGHLFRREGDEQQTTFFVDIGTHLTRALIAHGSQLAFAKLVQVGGEHFDRQYAEDLQIDLAEARQRRRMQTAGREPHPPAGTQPLEQSSGGNGGSAGRGARAGDQPTDPAAQPASVTTATAAGNPAEEMLPFEGETFDCLVDELHLCIGYHAAMFPNRPIDRLVFLGGTSAHTELCRRIARLLRLPAQLGDPLARVGRTRMGRPPVGVDFRQPQPGWAVPLGLCRLPTNL